MHREVCTVVPIGGVPRYLQHTRYTVAARKERWNINSCALNKQWQQQQCELVVSSVLAQACLSVMFVGFQHSLATSVAVVLTHPSHHWNTGHLLSTNTDGQHSCLCTVPSVQVPWSAGGGLQRGPVCGGERWVHWWCSTAEDVLYQGMFEGECKVCVCSCVCVCRMWWNYCYCNYHLFSILTSLKY